MKKAEAQVVNKKTTAAGSDEAEVEAEVIEAVATVIETEIIDENPKVVPEVRVASDTLILSSGVGVRNAALLPQKALAILDFYYNNIDPRTGVMSIVIREDARPTDHIGMAFPWVYSYAINMQHIFDRCLHHISEENSNLELSNAIWLSLLEACLHETVHIGMAFGDEKQYDEYLALRAEDQEATDDMVEGEVKGIARDKLLDLAKAVDIECPPIADMGLLGGLIMAHFIKHGDDKLVRRCQRLLESGVVYEDTAEETYHKTLRSFVKATLADENDEGWDESVAHVNMQWTDQAGNLQVAQAEPVVQTVLETAQPATAAAVVGNPQDMFTTGPVVAGVEDQAPENAIIQNLMSGGPAGTPEQVVAADTAQPVQSAAMAALAAANPTLPVMPASVMPPTMTPAVSLAPAATAEVVANNAAMTPPVPTPVASPPYADKPCTLDGEVVKACMQEIYLRLYHHLFTKCGWAQNPQTGRFAFLEPDNAKFSVNISDILTRFGAEGLIAEYETVDGNGQTVSEVCQGYIRGMLFRNKGIPAFKLFLNVQGFRATRSIVPQNPDKMTNNAYSRAAQEAQVGHAIAYIFNGEADSKAEWKDRCPAKIMNSQYMPQT